MTSEGSSSEIPNNALEFNQLQKSALIVGGAFLIGGILGVYANPQDPGIAFFTMGVIFAMLAWLFGTKSGREWIEKRANQQQQQTIGGSKDKPSKICQECGWKNDPDNNFCHDCGTALDNG